MQSAHRQITAREEARRHDLDWPWEPVSAYATGQALAYAYSAENADAAKSLTRDEARRIAANIAKLPELLNR